MVRPVFYIIYHEKSNSLKNTGHINQDLEFDVCQVIWSAQHRTYLIVTTYEINTKPFNKELNMALSRRFRINQQLLLLFQEWNAEVKVVEKYVFRNKYIHRLWAIVAKNLKRDNGTIDEHDT